ncbi:hypothetical protein V2G26_019812 [Clonostachys chloroleuca]
MRGFFHVTTVYYPRHLSSRIVEVDTVYFGAILPGILCNGNYRQTDSYQTRSSGTLVFLITPILPFPPRFHQSPPLRSVHGLTSIVTLQLPHTSSGPTFTSPALCLSRAIRRTLLACCVVG